MNTREGRGTGQWRQPGVPHKGWVCTGITDLLDLGEFLAVCEMRERREIRYAHTMEHEDYPDPLVCGCVCAGHMEEDLQAARDREATVRQAAAAKVRRAKAEAKRAAERQAERAHLLVQAWRTSRNGCRYLPYDGSAVFAFPASGGYNCHLRRDNETLRSAFVPDAKTARRLAVDWLLPP